MIGLKTLTIKDKGYVRVVELNRPKVLNALNAQMAKDLIAMFRSASADEEIKVVVLTGSGSAFWAGADLKEAAEIRAQWFEQMIESAIDFPKPLLIAVNGIGIGIGATICGLADAVFMADSARLRCPFSALGLTAEAASTITFRQLLGRQQASWFLLASEWMTADECVTTGLALETVPADELMKHVLAKAEILANLPLTSLTQTKALIVDPIREKLKQAMKDENQALANLRGSPANQEALAAFVEKRQPNFSGL